MLIPRARKNSTDSPLKKWNDELTRHLVALLEALFAKTAPQKPALEYVVEIVYVDQTRAPWPGSYLSPAKREIFKAWLMKNARILFFASERPSVNEFATKVSSRLLRELSAAQISSMFYTPETEKKAQLEHMIRQELHSQGSSEETLARSVQRYFRAAARERRFKEEIKAPENDPVRDLLGLPRIGRPLLPKEDIRVHMARFISHTKLLATLGDMANNVHDSLGEFSHFARFAGFMDKRQTILLLDVKSAGAAQELALNKVHLLSRLRKVPELTGLMDFQCRVRPPSFRSEA